MEESPTDELKEKSLLSLYRAKTPPPPLQAVTLEVRVVDKFRNQGDATPN